LPSAGEKNIPSSFFAIGRWPLRYRLGMGLAGMGGGMWTAGSFCLIILAYDLSRSWRRTFCPVFLSAVRAVAARCKLPLCPPPGPRTAGSDARALSLARAMAFPETPAARAIHDSPCRLPAGHEPSMGEGSHCTGTNSGGRKGCSQIRRSSHSCRERQRALPS